MPGGSSVARQLDRRGQNQEKKRLDMEADRHFQELEAQLEKP